MPYTNHICVQFTNSNLHNIISKFILIKICRLIIREDSVQKIMQQNDTMIGEFWKMYVRLFVKSNSKKTLMNFNSITHIYILIVMFMIISLIISDNDTR